MQSDKRAEGTGNSCHTVVECIRERISASGPPLSPQCCIYKVPSNIYHLNVAAYEPYVVSIGPFHHGKSNLKAMEDKKFRYLQSFLGRLELKLEDLVNTIKLLEEKTRACYGKNIELSSSEFVQMILVDGVFIVELFLRSYENDLPEDTDDELGLFLRSYITGLPKESDQKLAFVPGFLNVIYHDLFLLENQLPFFVLDSIFKLAFGHPSPQNFPTMLGLAFEFFSVYNIQKKQPTYFEGKVMHLLDLQRTFLLPPNPGMQRRSDKSFEFLHCATELHKAGVKFKKASSKCLLEINFENNILEIPRLMLEDKMKSYFRNLMVFELCYYPWKSYIVDYVFFMDYLINTTEDVDLLVQGGVIVNWLGDAIAVTTLFNNLTTNITMDGFNFYFAPICERLNAYRDVRWHHWKAIFKRDYFSTPWRTVATIAATMLLVLTLVQTICSIISLRK